MELTREQIRLLMLHEYKLSSKPNATETARRINQAWGKGTVGDRTVRERFAEFKNGNESLTHNQGAGRPKEIDRQAVLNAIETSPSLTTRMLADQFECAQSSIVEILKELGKVWKKTRWVPHELTEAQKAKRVNAAQVLLDRQTETPFLANRLITGDEKWISYVNPNPHGQWLDPNEKPDGTPKKGIWQKKAMLCVFWSARGVEYWELLEGQTVNSEVYCRQLDELNQRLDRRRRAQVVFLDDNAKPHRSKLTNAKIRELGWDRVDHPPYSPDLAPSDFHLFRSLQHFLKGKRFENFDKMAEAVKEFFDSKDAEFYRRRIMKLPEKWEEVIEVDGEYFD